MVHELILAKEKRHLKKTQTKSGTRVQHLGVCMIYRHVHLNTPCASVLRLNYQSQLLLINICLGNLAILTIIAYLNNNFLGKKKADSYIES